MKPARSSTNAAFTITEMMVAGTGLVITGMMAFLVLNGGTLLYARNVSSNHTNTELRLSMDRVFNEINTAEGIPGLINDDGSSCTSGSAAGVRFDKYLGGPYLVTHPGGTGLLAGAMSFLMQRSTHPAASPPVPQAGDVILIQGEPGVRCVVASCQPGLVGAGNVQTLAVNLSTGLQRAVSWKPAEFKSAILVRRVAITVLDTGGRAELRYYPTAETLTNYENQAGFSVVASEIAVQSGGATPFSIVTLGGNSFVGVSLGVRKVEMGKLFASRDPKEVNTFLSANTLLRPRNSD
jgi:hypothetical protein